ncbi:MAG: hypothetical protein ACOCV1_00865 [Bacillota bacterium]
MIKFIDIDLYSSCYIKKIEDVVFYYTHNIKESDVVKKIHQYNKKYPLWGLIITDNGYLINCSKINFSDFNIKNMYYEFTKKGISCIRNESITNY